MLTEALISRPDLRRAITRACDEAHTPNPERRRLIALADDPTVTRLARGRFVLRDHETGERDCLCPIGIIADRDGWLNEHRSWPAFALSFAYAFDDAIAETHGGATDVLLVADA